MKLAALVPMRHHSQRVPGKNAYTYGDRKHVYFIKKMKNTMGATHDSDLTDINDGLSARLYNRYNPDMTWNFTVVDAATGDSTWATIYMKAVNFMWSTGSISRKHITFLEHSDGSWEMIRGYVAYDPIDAEVFIQ